MLSKYSAGDVTLSGEDRPPPHPIHKHTHHHIHQPQLVDYQVEYDEEEAYYDDDDYVDEEYEEHHLSTSFKYLLAGGIAGAGEQPSFPRKLSYNITKLFSIPNRDCSFRQTESIPYHTLS